MSKANDIRLILIEIADEISNLCKITGNPDMVAGLNVSKHLVERHLTKVSTEKDKNDT